MRSNRANQLSPGTPARPLRCRPTNHERTQLPMTNRKPVIVLATAAALASASLVLSASAQTTPPPSPTAPPAAKPEPAPMPQAQKPTPRPDDKSATNPAKANPLLGLAVFSSD